MSTTRTTHGACGKSWLQRGNRSGHCANCHDTYYGIRAFDEHQHVVAGELVCARMGRRWWADVDGQWHNGDGESVQERLRP